MVAGLRSIADPLVVAAPTGARIHTRLHLSANDERVLREVGVFLGGLAGHDLAARCVAGVCGEDKHFGRTERKQALTEATSSRWAGAITRITADQWERARLNQIDERRYLRQAG